MADVKTIWIVMGRDYDSERPVAAYESEELAEAHAKEMNLFVQSTELLDALPAEVVDIDEKAKRAAESQERQANDAQEMLKRAEIRARRYTITASEALKSGGTLLLCCCQTFNESPMWTENGYCIYCGKWEPEVVRRHCGEAELLRQIMDLDIHDRKAMLAICGFA